MTAAEKQSSVHLPSVAEDGRSESPSAMGLRHRPTQVSFNSNDPLPQLHHRRSSFFSDNLSDTRKSFRYSTDDLLLPRVTGVSAADDQVESTHWHSAPLVLALLPAVGGLLFKDGSAIITDITLLGLSAIFLNWMLRLPWDWYHTAQAAASTERSLPSPFTPTDEELNSSFVDVKGDEGRGESSTPQDDIEVDQDRIAAQQELRVHELAALLTCFFAPLGGAWLLHAIRSQLSRPSEGLVSNYNLTIFILVAELRPLSHLMKLVQRRTLFLQKKVNFVLSQDQHSHDAQDTAELVSRLDELEAHIANTAAATTQSSVSSLGLDTVDAVIAKASSQAGHDMRKTMQPELDALNRAMRRYEKRMTITAVQVEARLQDLEARLKDVVVLAAAAQRNAEARSRSYAVVLVDRLCALVVVPLQLAIDAAMFPARCLRSALLWFSNRLKLTGRLRKAKDNPQTSKKGSGRAQTYNKKGKGPI